MKRLLLLVMFLPLMLWSQDIGVSGSGEATTDVNGMVGSVTIGKTTYSQIRLMPEVTFGKFGLGLDIDLLIDADGNLRKEDWDEAKDLINKIYYIRYAQRGDMIYGKAGGFPFYTLGHGLIMSDYSNNLLYPNQRNIGLMFGFNLPMPFKPGAELFTSNIEKNEILAFNAHFQPLSLTDIHLLSSLSLGASFATDRNQYGKFDDKDNDKVPDIFDPNIKRKNHTYDIDGDGTVNSLDLDIDGDGILDSPWVNSYVASQYPAFTDSTLALLLDNQITSLRRYGDKKDVLIYSVDYELPLIDNAVFKLSHYAEYAKIKDYGTGLIFPGFYSKFMFMEANMELRRFEDKFIPGYFDHLYDDQRAYVMGDTIVTKDLMLDGIKSAMGWYGSLKANVFNVIQLKVSYQDMYGEDQISGKSLWARVGVDPIIVPKLKEASIGYSQTNVKYISVNKLHTPSAVVDGRASYGLSESTFLVAKYSERYVDVNGNNVIKGKDEIIKSMTFGVEFKF